MLLRAQEREKFSSKRDDSDAVLTVTQCKVNVSFLLDPSEAAYALIVEVPFPIELVGGGRVAQSGVRAGRADARGALQVILQSSLGIDTLESASSTAIMSRVAPDTENDCVFLATYRCTESANRLEMRMRTCEVRYRARASGRSSG